MNQNLLSLMSLKMCFHGLIQSSYIGFRFVRYKCYPWLTLAITPFKLLFSTGVQRTQVQIRYLRAISKINFAGMYEVVNDLLW